MITTLDKIAIKEKAIVISLGEKSNIRRRLIDMGITPKTEITVKKYAPFGDPIQINLRGYELSIRKSEAEKIIVEKISGGDL